MLKPRAVFSFSTYVPSRLRRLCAGLLLTGVTAATQASDAVEEVVVTAEFRPVTAAEVPGSVSVLDPDANGDLINHLDELV